MEITGTCHCGNIRYRTKIDEKLVSLCHCTDCQAMTGSPYRVSAASLVDDFELISGQPKIYVKTADSGAKRAQAFCPNCGTPLYAESLENPHLRTVRWGSIEQRSQLLPTRQIWCQSAIPWAENISDIVPKFDRKAD